MGRICPTFCRAERDTDGAKCYNRDPEGDCGGPHAWGKNGRRLP